MRHLSQSSIDLITALNRHKEASFEGAAMTRLFTELYDMVGEGVDRLNNSVKIPYNFTLDVGSISKPVFTFTFESFDKNNRSESTLKFVFNPMGESSVSLGYLNKSVLSPAYSDLLHSFENSVAFKRYFIYETDQRSSIKATFSLRQLKSRHFNEYLCHVLDHMIPFLRVMSGQLSMAVAA